MVKIFKTSTIFKNLLLNYILIIILTIIPIIIFISLIYRNYVQDFHENYSINMVQQIHENIDNRISDFEYNVFYNIWVDDAYFSPKNQLYLRKVHDSLSGLLYSFQYINTIQFDNDTIHDYISRDNVIISGEAPTLSVDENINHDLHGSTFWFRVEDRDDLYMMKQYFNKHTLKFDGIFILGIDELFIKDVFTGKEKGAYYVLYNNAPLITINNSHDPISFFTNDIYKQNTGQRYITHDGSELLVTWYTDESDFKIINVISQQTILSGLNILIITIVIVSCIVFLVVSFLSTYMSNNFSKKIQFLLGKIKHIEEGDFDYHVSIHSKDELAEVDKRLDIMSHRIRQLVDDLSNEKVAKKSAELKALQAEYAALQNQLNPHFLYNTLESINSLAKLEQYPELSSSITSLANLYRGLSKNKDQEITLEQEMKYISDYITIFHILMPGKINMEYDLDPATFICKIPKLILQPLIENAIVHGISQSDTEGLILIISYTKNNDLYIDISDNGVGCEVNLDTMNSFEHTGLKNIHKRIQILYGTDYGLTFNSSSNIGTTITVKLPYKED